MNEHDPKNAARSYYPLEELKKLPESFWLGVPTASKIIYDRGYFSSSDSSHKYWKRHYNAHAWKLMEEHAHKIIPQLAFDADRPPESFINKDKNDYAVWIIDDCVFRHQSFGRGLQVWDSKRNVWEIYMWSGEESQKALKKIETTWNRLRKSARRKAGVDADSATEAKKKIRAQDRAFKKQRHHVITVATEANIVLEDYIHTLQSGEEITKSQISDVYDALISLTSANKQFKKIAGYRIQ